MGSRRTLILIAAIAMGVVAAFALFNYVGGIEDRANGNARRVQVYVVRGDVPKGAFGEEAEDQNLIVADEIPAEFRPATAITDIDQIQGRVALNNLSANQVIVDGMFVDPQVALTTFSERIPENQVAITVSVDQIRGVAGLLVPGDEVNILVTQSGGAQGDGGEGDPAAGGETFPQNARFLYQKVQILAVGQSPVPDPGEAATTATDGEEGAEAAPAAEAAQNTGLITFNVPAEAAQHIASVSPDQLYLTLVPEDYAPVPLPQLDRFAPLMPGEDGGKLTPYGPEGN